MNSSPKQKNKTIVITGATSGIGYAAAQVLAQKGANVIGVGRSPERCQNATMEIRAQAPHAEIEFLRANLASQRQIRELAQAIEAWVQARGLAGIDVLINNAGMVTNWYTATEDGYEMQFAVNHLAPFLLTHELMPLLKTAPAGRVLTVSSNSHRRTRIHWRDVMLRRRYNTLRAYKQSKLANVMFSAEFNRRFADKTSLHAYAIDPGLVNTDIGLKGTGGLVRWVWQRRQQKGVTPEEGAWTVVYLAADPVVAGSTAVYWKDCHPVTPSKYAQRTEEAARLWRLSERLCGLSNWE